MKKPLKILLFPFAFMLISGFSFGQKKLSEPSYRLDFLNAHYKETEQGNEIVLLFKYQPNKKKEFKPIFSMKISYQLGNSELEKTEILNESKHSLVFYGNDIDQKNPVLYQFISDKIDLKQKENLG